MKNYTNSIKTLINSNLLFINEFNKTSKKKSSLNLNSNLKYLDPLEFIKNVKQFTRLLQFIQNQRNSTLYLDSENVLLKETLELFKFDRKEQNSIHFIDDFLKSSKSISDKFCSKKRKSYLFLYINQNSFTSNYFKMLFTKGFYLAHSINSTFTKNNIGYYKLHSDINEIKTIFFLILVLKKNLLQKKDSIL